MARAFGAAEHSSAAADRSHRSRTGVRQMHDGSGPAELLAVFCANVIHIAPWRVAEGLFAGAGAICAATAGCFSMARSSARAGTPR